MTLPRLDARSEWDERFGVRTAIADSDGVAGEIELPAPEHVSVAPGRGQVTLWWSPVPGAVGYLVARAPRPEGPFVPVHLAEADVLAVPSPPFLDTQVTHEGSNEGPTEEIGDRQTGERETASLERSGSASVGGWYRVAALAAPGGRPGVWSAPVEGTADESAAATAGRVTLTVETAQPAGVRERPWRVVGLEHPGELLLRDDGFGHDVRHELLEALRIGRAELGVEMVRAHHIFDDALGVYREGDGGEMILDFTVVDELMGLFVAGGIRPIVELSFMPAALASDHGRPCSTTGPSSHRRGTSGAGRRSVAGSSRTSVSASGGRRSGAGASKSGTSRTSPSFGPGRRRSTSPSATQLHGQSRMSTRS